MPGEFYIEGSKEKVDVAEIHDSVVELRQEFDTMQERLDRLASFRDYWSRLADRLTITDVAVDITFPEIVVAGLPQGVSLRAVNLMLISRAINNTSAGANYIADALKTIRVKRSTGTWGVDDLVAITLDQNLLYLAGGQKEMGLAIIGDADIKSEVDGNATYQVMSNQTVRGDAIRTSASAMELYDVQVGLRVYFS